MCLSGLISLLLGFSWSPGCYSWMPVINSRQAVKRPKGHMTQREEFPPWCGSVCGENSSSTKHTWMRSSNCGGLFSSCGHRCKTPIQPGRLNWWSTFFALLSPSRQDTFQSAVSPAAVIFFFFVFLPAELQRIGCRINKFLFTFFFFFGDGRCHRQMSPAMLLNTSTQLVLF